MPENVKSIKDFKEIKKVKVYITHLKTVLKVIELSIKGLEKFEVYVPVHEILVVMRNQQKILESHLKKYQNNIKEKE